jgi:hypothetical protein
MQTEASAESPVARGAAGGSQYHFVRMTDEKKYPSPKPEIQTKPKAQIPNGAVQRLQTRSSPARALELWI